MSLIQDALKRLAEETAGARLPGQPIEQPAPPVPPPEREKPKALPPQEKKKTKPFPIVPLILFLMVFLVAMLGLSLYLIKPKLKPDSKVPQESVPAERDALLATPEPVKAPVVPVLTVESIVESAAPPLVTEQEADPVQKIKKTWPELKLTGIAQGGDRQRVAILNGKMLSAGRRLGEVAIIQVRDSTVIVEYRGERRTLYIGE
jgi:hypothetical protein